MSEITNQKIFITGGTGFLGSHLIEHLVRHGAKVTALYRKDFKLPQNQEGVRWVKGDLFSEEWDLKGYDVVYHLAGFVGYKKEERAIMEHVNVEGTQRLLKKLKEAQYEPKLIHLSSVVTVGAGKHPQDVLDETSPYNMSDYDFGYFETKKRAEDLVFEESQKGLFAVALNPSTIYGPRDFKKSSRKFQLKMAQGKLKYYPEGGVSVVHVDDVCKALLVAPYKGRSGERYILAGDNVTIKTLLDEIAVQSGVPKVKIKVPTFLLLLVGHLAQIFRSTKLSLENLRVATLYHWFKHDKAKRELGFKPHSYKEALKDSLAWAKKEGLI